MAIEIDPKFAEAYNYRGTAYANRDQHDRAISDYSKAIALNLKFAMAYNNRAVSYYFEKKHDKAQHDVHKAQSLGYQVHPGFLNALSEALR